MEFLNDLLGTAGELYGKYAESETARQNAKAAQAAAARASATKPNWGIIGGIAAGVILLVVVIAFAFRK